MAMEEVSHKGRIIEITPQITSVSIISASACSSCHAAGLCGMGEQTEKIIQVPTDPWAMRNVGDEVDVVLKASMGLKAVWLSYVVPLVLLLAVILTLLPLGVPEVAAGLSGIGAVALWYFVLWLFRGKLRNEYIFVIK